MKSTKRSKKPKRNSSATNDAVRKELRTIRQRVCEDIRRDDTFWVEAVSEGKEIVARAETDQMRLGELADEVKSKYGEKKLAKFAVEIGVAPCTLKRRRSVYRAWKEKGATPPRLYSVAQELAAHPDRAEIVKKTPNITAREARVLMSEVRGSDPKPKAPKDSDQDHNKRTLRDLASLANQAIGATEFVDQHLTSKQQRNLRESIESELLKIIRQGGEALVKAADFLQALLKQEED